MCFDALPLTKDNLSTCDVRRSSMSCIKDSEAGCDCSTVESETGVVVFFTTENRRARDHRKTILPRIYGKLMLLREPIRKAIMDVFCRMVYEHKQQNEIGELVEMLGSIITWFAVPIS